MFEAESEIGSQAKIVKRAHVGFGTESGAEVQGGARLELYLGFNLNLVMNLQLRLGLKLGLGVGFRLRLSWS